MMITTRYTSRPVVALNLLFLIPGQVGGTETYARGLLSGLVAASHPFVIRLFVNQAAWDSFLPYQGRNGIEVHRCDIPLANRSRHIWEQLRLPMVVRKHAVDVLHSLGYVGPIFLPCKSVVTIHDMLYKRFPLSISLAKRLFWRGIMPLSARRSDAVVTVSNASKQDIVNLLRVPEQKVFVTLEGPGQDFSKMSSWNEVRAKYHLPETFFLAVGTASHKRHAVTLKALQLLKSRRGIHHDLIMVGQREWGPVSQSQCHDHVRFVGYVPAEDLCALYSRARALVCSSALEGFGLPILEAMRLGTPVLLCAGGAVEEVAGTAAIAVPPDDADALEAAMWELLTNGETHRQLSLKGRERALEFSWESCAHKTLEVYERVLNTK